MRIWPVILDSQPQYVEGRGGAGSLLSLPLGAQTVFEFIHSCVASLTPNAPTVITRGAMGSAYERDIHAVAPNARIVGDAGAVADVIASLELSDALLIIDPQFLALRPLELADLVQRYSLEPRLAHHLVAFEHSVAGTSERVSFDASGNVRRILRHYEPATWPFIAGVSATMLPVASGVLADGHVPTTLAEVRRDLVARGVTGQDIPVRGGSLDLTKDSGLLAANEHFIRRAASVSPVDAAPVLVGTGHAVSRDARITSNVVLHPGARVDAGAMVLGPAVIGAGARIEAGASVIQSVVLPDSVLPSGQIIRSIVWCEKTALTRPEPGGSSYAERVEQLTVEARNHGQDEAEREDGPPAPRVRHARAKRAIDATGAGLALLVLSPLFLLVAAVVWLESRRPIFYGDEREGMGGRAFRCWKFRTMFVGANAVQNKLKSQDQMDGPHFKLDQDPRVTRVGRVLRALNLDELPQLFNVLVGEMSFVGPRPSPFRENQVCVPWREGRLSVRPGITGFWQVCRHDRSLGDFHQWIEYDLLYVQHLSLWLDLRILCATLLTLGGKLRHVPAEWLVPASSLAKPQPAEAPSLLSRDAMPMPSGRRAATESARPIISSQIPARVATGDMAFAAVSRPAQTTTASDRYPTTL